MHRRRHIGTIRVDEAQEELTLTVTVKGADDKTQKEVTDLKQLSGTYATRGGERGGGKSRAKVLWCVRGWLKIVCGGGKGGVNHVCVPHAIAP